MLSTLCRVPGRQADLEEAASGWHTQRRRHPSRGLPFGSMLSFGPGSNSANSKASCFPDGISSSSFNLETWRSTEVIDLFINVTAYRFFSIKNDSTNVCFRARRFRPTTTSFAFCCRPRSINTLANLLHLHSAEGPALVQICSHNCLRS